MLYRHQEQTTQQIIRAHQNPQGKRRVVEREEKTDSGITEIVLPNQRGLDMVLPTLAFLSKTSKALDGKHSRWLTWLHTPEVSKEILQRYDFDLRGVRFVYPKNNEQCFELFERALMEGNSHTVVASLGILSEQQLQQLEAASHTGRCSGLLLRHRIH